ncbi:outer membrane beta-barrel protein [Formosa haliotis]|uniref:outer membrane beta-barrel protein n=1 Tax=Formosa haliotis TaxID=1555194 RepID=UPI000824D9FB|nr:outer membrane beta-barrel protein [Formosa haliotis]
MKKLILTLCIVVGALNLSTAQSGSGYGIKGGLNYGANGNYFSSISNTVKHPDKNVGFHLGVFGKFGDWIYFKPELMYTNTSSEYDAGKLKVQKLDLPALFGIRLIGPLSIFAGPAFQYILDSKFDDVKADDIDKDISMGFNFGFAVNIRKIGIDLRYERGFSKNETKFIENNGIDVVSIDSRPSQLILSLSVKL